MRNNESVRVVITVALSVALAGSGVIPGLACAGAARESPADAQTSEGVSADVAEIKPDVTMTRDDAYRRALTDYDRLASSWTTRPADLEALLASAASLGEAIGALSAPGGASVQTTHHETGSGVAAPAGRATPSAEPTSATDAEARRRATDEFLSVPVPEAGSVKKTLGDVSEERVREASAEMRAELDCLERLWRAGSTETEAIQACVSSLGRILESLSQPRSSP